MIEIKGVLPDDTTDTGLSPGRNGNPVNFFTPMSQEAKKGFKKSNTTFGKTPC